VYIDSSFSDPSAWSTVAFPDSIFTQWNNDAFPSDIYFNGGALAFHFDTTVYSYNLDVPGSDTSFSFSVSLKSNQTCYFRLGASAPDGNGHYSGKLDTGATHLSIVVFAENGRDSLNYQIYLYKPADMLQDQYENDNTRASASVLTVNGPPQNRTLTFNDTDWMAINITKDTTYRIATASQGILISCFAQTASGYYLFSAPAEDSSLNRAVYFTAETTGTCYLEVMQAAEWPPVPRQGAYTIAINTTPNPGEPDSNSQAAQPITVNGDSLYRTLTPQDVDWFYFTALSGKHYHIISDNAPIIRLYDSTGTGYIAADIGGVIDWDCTASGKYLLKVGDTFYTENYFYKIWIYSAP
jgi:hypothetical protein